MKLKNKEEEGIHWSNFSCCLFFSICFARTTNATKIPPKIAPDMIVAPITPFFTGSTPEFFWPMVIALSVLAFGLPIEIILRVLKIKKEDIKN